MKKKNDVSDKGWCKGSWFGFFWLLVVDII